MPSDKATLATSVRVRSSGILMLGCEAIQRMNTIVNVTENRTATQPRNPFHPRQGRDQMVVRVLFIDRSKRLPVHDVEGYRIGVSVGGLESRSLWRRVPLPGPALPVGGQSAPANRERWRPGSKPGPGRVHAGQIGKPQWPARWLPTRPRRPGGARRVRADVVAGELFVALLGSPESASLSGCDPLRPGRRRRRSGSLGAIQQAVAEVADVAGGSQGPRGSSVITFVFHVLFVANPLCRRVALEFLI